MTTNKKIIGGWFQYWDVVPPQSFSYAMYGMFTTLDGDKLETPGLKTLADKPTVSHDTGVMWVYGGQYCSPEGYPTEQGMQEIVEGTHANQWAGVDFDDECNMNTANIVKTMQQLKEIRAQSSYTFVAGADFVNDDVGVDQLKEVAAGGCCDRFCLMCYGGKMWTGSEIKQYVDPAIKKTIDIIGDKSKVILVLTPMGLNDENLNEFLGLVNSNDIGGLFVWEFKDLKSDALKTMEKALGLD